jgi:hypothetical protein
MVHWIEDAGDGNAELDAIHEARHMCARRTDVARCAPASASVCKFDPCRQ